MTNTDLALAVEEFAKLPTTAGKAMRDMLAESGPQAFMQAAVCLLRSDLEQRGKQYLLTLLMMNDLILTPLLDPAVFSLGEAVAIAGQLIKIEPLLDIKMVRRLLGLKTGQDEAQKRAIDSTGMRVLEITSAISDGARTLPVLAQLLNHSDMKIRSKAALLIGRGNKNCGWVEQRLADPDSRVRANVVESLWGVDSTDAKSVLWAAVNDPNNRVLGNALLGLHNLGELASLPLIVELLSHPDANFRTTGAWVAGETGDPRFLPLVARMMGDPDPRVRTTVFRSTAKLKRAEAKCPAAQNLRFYISPAAAEPGLWREITAAIWMVSANGVQSVVGLRPSQFALYEDSRLVTAYEIRENRPVDSVYVAFVLPQSDKTDHPFHLQSQAAFEAALLHKRKSDSWLTLKYLSEEEPAAEVAQHGGPRIYRIDSPEPVPASSGATLPSSKGFFHREPDAILSAMAVTGDWTLPQRNPLKAMSTALSPLSRCVGNRQLVLLYDPATPETDWAPWQNLATLAKLSRVNVHIFALSREPELVQLAATTAGTFSLLVTPADFKAALEGLCASLVDAYSIRYRTTAHPDVAPAARLKIRVYQEARYGES